MVSLGKDVYRGRRVYLCGGGCVWVIVIDSANVEVSTFYALIPHWSTWNSIISGLALCLSSCIRPQAELQMI